MQSVSMKCSKEQYQQDLKQALAELGYVEMSMLIGSDDQYDILNTYDDKHLHFVNTHEGYSWAEVVKDSHLITEYNPKLFLAIAAMSEGDDWTVGEWLWHKVGKKVYQFKHLGGCK